MLPFPRSCCHLQQVEDRDTILPLMRTEEEMMQQGYQKKRSLLEEISTLKEKKRRLGSYFEALKHSADSYAEKAESAGWLTLTAN